MKKASPIIAILLTFILTFSILTPAFADGNSSEGTGAGSSSSVSDEIKEDSKDKSDEKPSEEEPKEEEPKDESKDNSTVNNDTSSSEAVSTTTEKATETTTENTTEQTSQTTEKKGFSLKNEIYSKGVPTLTTSTFFKIYQALRFAKYVVTGKILFSKPKTLNVTMDDALKEICDTISSNSALDVYQLLTNLPDESESIDNINKVLNIDTAEYRKEMYALAEQYKSEGNSAMYNITYAVGILMSSIKSAQLELVPQGDSVYKVHLILTYSDGGTERLQTYILINTETGECYGYNDKGMLKTGFNCNYKEGLVYAPINCWMRNFGFCFEYDLLCYSAPVYCYNTRRFHFEYNNKDYMIQMWKGNYLITNGGEVGVYYRDKGKYGTFYNVVKSEDQLDMSLQIWHGDDLLVNITEQNHWWVNGFKMGTRLYSPHSLTLKTTILMTDEEMLKAFTTAVDRNIWKDVTYTVDGLRVSLTWDS